MSSIAFVFDRLDGLSIDELHRAADDLSDLLRDRWPSCHLDRIERTAPSRADHAPGRTARTCDPRAVRIRAGGPGDLDLLEPLWVAVHHRHAASMPELAPYVDDATTWGVRRALYAELLGKPDTVLLLAEDGAGAAVGYGLAHVMAREDTWVDDTWVTGPRIGEIESLSVLPAHRDAGVGTALLDRLEVALAEQGVTDLVLGVLPGNDAARRLYERRGWRPTCLYLSRFDRPVGPG